MERDLLLLAVICAAVGYGIYKKRRIYRDIDKLLDCVLNQEEIIDSEVKEGEFSSLVSKIGRIQQMLGRQVECAREEKEQVKSIVSNMSHQLKTPLANLSIYTDILDDPKLSDEKRKEMSGKMKKQIEKLGWIIGSLMKMIKLEQDVIVFEAHMLPIRQTILEAIDSVYEKVEKKGIRIERKNIHVSVACPKDIVLVHDRKWTAEVFVNILENAVKYTKSGGTIQIRVHSYETYTKIQLIDNGCGIHEEEIPHIFGRFYRGRETENVEGCGIGLYLSGLIFEKEKGYMTVESEYGEGSCFSVFLQNCKN